jgi:uncharacterized protein (DUF302 family)
MRFIVVVFVNKMELNMNTTDLYFSKTLQGSILDVRPKIEAELKEVGFGVLTEIDMKAKLAEKVGADIKPYTLLGVCNPKFAHEALKADENIGVFLPCKVVLKEVDSNKTEVLVLNPEAPMKLLNNEKLNQLAEEVTQLLRSAVARI